MTLGFGAIGELSLGETTEEAGSILLGGHGIVSAETFGVLEFTIDDILFDDIAGIASAEVFGNPSVIGPVESVSIASAEMLGSPSGEIVVSPTGIASGEAFGTLVFTRNPTGIASAEAFGTPSLGEYVVYLPASRL